MVKKQINSKSNYNYNSNSNYNHKSNSNTIGSYFKMGFGLGLGLILVQVIFSFIALTLFISGFVLLKREQAKEKKGEKASEGLKIFAYVLMFFGAAFAMFLIIPLLSELGGEFGDF